MENEAQTWGANSESALGLAKVLETFEKEEKAKQGTNIVSKYSEFQLNKVPSSNAEVAKFPKLYKAFIDEQDYERALNQSKHNP